jgi:hypothetical protein
MQFGRSRQAKRYRKLNSEIDKKDEVAPDVASEETAEVNEPKAAEGEAQAVPEEAAAEGAAESAEKEPRLKKKPKSQSSPTGRIIMPDFSLISTTLKSVPNVIAKISFVMPRAIF